MESPCIHICSLDRETGLCIGCRRTMQEIVEWTAYTDQDRTRIMLDLPNRTDATSTHPENAPA